MKQEHQDYLTSEIQRLMTLLNMKTGIYNIETCVANGKPYIMEVSPRGGGCKIAELQRMAYGVDLIEAEVKKQSECLLMKLNRRSVTDVGVRWLYMPDLEKWYIKISYG